MSEVRNLSEGDVKAIVDALEERLTDKFYRDLGKGLWGLVFKGLVTVALFIAAYGGVKYGGAQ